MADIELVASPLYTTWTPDANRGSASVSHQQLAAALDALSALERVVLSLLYFEELTVPEAAAVMGRSEVGICHLHDRALVALGL